MPGSHRCCCSGVPPATMVGPAQPRRDRVVGPDDAGRGQLLVDDHLLVGPGVAAPRVRGQCGATRSPTRPARRRSDRGCAASQARTSRRPGVVGGGRVEVHGGPSVRRRRRWAAPARPGRTPRACAARPCRAGSPRGASRKTRSSGPVRWTALPPAASYIRSTAALGLQRSRWWRPGAGSRRSRSPSGPSAAVGHGGSLDLGVDEGPRRAEGRPRPGPRRPARPAARPASASSGPAAWRRPASTSSSTARRARPSDTALTPSASAARNGNR